MKNAVYFLTTDSRLTALVWPTDSYVRGERHGRQGRQIPSPLGAAASLNEQSLETPGWFGMGSSTLFNWITRKMEEDVKNGAFDGLCKVPETWHCNVRQLRSHVELVKGP